MKGLLTITFAILILIVVIILGIYESVQSTHSHKDPVLSYTTSHKKVSGENALDKVKYSDLQATQKNQDCFLVHFEDNKPSSLYVTLKKNIESGDLSSIPHDIHDLRLLCFDKDGSRHRHFLSLDQIGVQSVQYHLANKQLIVYGILLDGSRTTFVIAPENLLKIPQKKQKTLQDLK